MDISFTAAFSYFVYSYSWLAGKVWEVPVEGEGSKVRSQRKDKFNEVRPHSSLVGNV